MILGMSTALFTLVHVVISLIALFAGLVVTFGLLRSQRLPGWTALFLLTTILTSVTGFLFHSKAFGPPHVVGVISLVVLAICAIALYGLHLRGTWRPIYVVTALLAFYFNAFVAVAQSFDKIGFLHALAPTQKEPPFAVAQLIVVVLFVYLGVRAAKKFHPESLITLGPRVQG
ncbi:MAG TPA: hypothetical protein VLX90_16430 [Steroidobacteraceae bacterium]|nr:hypothetical protein [Steroidobacteraceae bacterium]